VFPPIAAHPTWAALAVAGPFLGPTPAICPLACVLQSADLYQMAFAQSEEAVHRARLTRRLLESAAGFNSRN
jgi:hypothetical protein